MHKRRELRAAMDRSTRAAPAAVFALATLLLIAATPLWAYRTDRRAPAHAQAGPLPEIRAAPDSSVHGSATDVTLLVWAADDLDGDGATDLVLGELPTGTRGDETTEPLVLLGRGGWPASAGIETMAPKRMSLPSLGKDDSLEILGTGDIDGDGRADIVTQHVRRSGTRVIGNRVGIHFSPEAWPSRPSFVRPDFELSPESDILYLKATAATPGGWPSTSVPC